MTYGKGHAAPKWMDTFESIEAVACIYRQRVPPLVERLNGVLSFASVKDGIVVCIDDRMSGRVYCRCVDRQEPGDIIRREWKCRVNGSPDHSFTLHMLILRLAPAAEVRALANQNVAGMTIPIIDGYWYEVQVD